jgi:hypothetical protein
MTVPGDRVIVRGDCGQRLHEERWTPGTVMRVHENGHWWLVRCDTANIIGPRGHGTVTPYDWWCDESLLVPEMVLTPEQRRAKILAAIVAPKPMKRYGPFKPRVRSLPA